MRVLTVDDHALIREALRSVFADVRPQAEVLEAAGRALALEQAGLNRDIALIVLDLALPDGNGVELLVELRSLLPNADVVVLSASSESGMVAKVLRLGAKGFIPKSAPYAVMIAAFELVLAGGIYVPAEILASVRDTVPSDLLAVLPPDDGNDLGDLALTDRQREVLALLVQGKSNKLICRELQIAEPTVKNHITAILKALKVSSRTEAIAAMGVRTSLRQ